MKYFVIAESLVKDKAIYEWLIKHAQLVEKTKKEEKTPKKFKSVKDFTFKIDNLFEKP